MSVIRIASRYAKSLIELAIESDKLERVKSDMESFKGIIADNRDFYLLLKSPVVPPSKKRAILKDIFEGKFDDLTMAFLNILVAKHREAYLPEVAKEFMLQYKHIMHISSVHLITAEPVGESSISAIRKKLKDAGITDDNIEFRSDVDPSIQGGYILEFDGNLIDASIRSKLAELKKEFSENLYISKIIAR
jgi:F-type H+-transporting ATPase subunit delta